MAPVMPILNLFSVCLLILFSTSSASAEINVPRSEISNSAYQRLIPQLKEEMQKKNLRIGQPIFVRIFKEEKELEVWVKKDLIYEHFKTYTICNYSGTLGPKLYEGDKQSPEGFYTVSVTALNPWSNFHLSFNIGYPNEYDLIHNCTGNALMVHGKCSSVGCYAMNDFRIEEIYTIIDAALSNGQERFSVHIFPFRMTWDKLAQNNHSQWLSFWENLKQGYDYFQGHRTPPLVTVEEKRYAFQTPLPSLFGSDLASVQIPQEKELVVVKPKPSLSPQSSPETKLASITIKPDNEKKSLAIEKSPAKNKRSL
jgi:murein L,D-transpeptidase YafK